MSFSRLCPPTDGSVTLPETIDYHLKYNPNNPLFVFHEDGKPDIINVSYLEFGRAADRAAHCIRPGRTGADGQVIAIIALSDTLLYHALTLGIMRAGLIPYPMSPRNTAAAVIKLLKDTNCHRIISTRETLQPLIGEIKSELPFDYLLSIEEMPPLHDIYPKLGHEKIEDTFEPYPKGTRPLLSNIAMHLHSSGSTGLPKTIPKTFTSLLHWARIGATADLRDYSIQLRIGGMILPPFHTLGLLAQVIVGLYGVRPIALYPPIATTPHALPMAPTAANVIDLLQRTKVNCLIVIPSFLQIWAQDQLSVEALARLELVAYSGGSVPPKLGNMLVSAGVRLRPVFGATEFGAITCLAPRLDLNDTWEYMEFSNIPTIRWVAQGDGTYECQLLSTETHEISVENLPDVKGYATSDLLIPHPAHSHLWKIIGRKDDVIVHTSGEKTVPAPMEDILLSSPFITGAVMFGRDHDRAGVLIEVKPNFSVDLNDEMKATDMRNTLWPIVGEANAAAPAFSRIFKEMILFASRDKPLARAAKGTVMRKASLIQYQNEIEQLYAKIEATVKVDSVVPPVSWELSDTIEWLKSQLGDIFGGRTFADNGDLFDQGMDSLSVTILRRRIVGAMQSKDMKNASSLILQTTIYSYPSISKLAAFLVGVVADPDNFVITTSRTDAIENMIMKYSSGLSESAIDPHVSSRNIENEPVILLTGSTGNLGAQILNSLLRDSKVKTVYTINRALNSKTIVERQAARFADKGFDTDLLSSPRLVFLEADISRNELGLNSDVYQKLLKSVNIIIHTAWKLDFNLSLSSFELNIQGTRNLVDFARSSSSYVKFLFTSSSSSAFSWDKSQGPYPEKVVMDPRYAVGNGYGESKYVSERILVKSGIQATSFRIGQISGGYPNGAWATSDWVPILVKSSVRLQALPSAKGISPWLPMHAASQSILDLAWSPHPAPMVLNLVHPRSVFWNSIMSFVNIALVHEGIIFSKLPIVSFPAWVSLLEKHAANASDGDFTEIPAIKLLDFFKLTSSMDDGVSEPDAVNVEAGGLPTFSTTAAQTHSETMRNLPQLSESDAVMWVKYWKDVGFL